MSNEQTEALERYVIRKGGCYYRPNAQGYTTFIHEAGRYSLADAISLTHPNGPDGPRDGLSYMPAPAATPSPAPSDTLEAAFPATIGRLNLGARRSDGERLCSHGHAVPEGHPLYWPQLVGQYDDSDPYCLEHAIDLAVSDNSWCTCNTGGSHD